MGVGGLEIGKIISAFTSNPEVSSKLRDLVDEDVETQADGVAKIVKENAGLDLGRDQILGILQSFGGLQGVLGKVASGGGKPGGIDETDVSDAVSNLMGK